MIKEYPQKKVTLFGKKFIKSFGKTIPLLYNISDNCCNSKFIKT